MQLVFLSGRIIMRRIGDYLKNMVSIAINTPTWPIQKINIHLIISDLLFAIFFLTFAIS